MRLWISAPQRKVQRFALNRFLGADQRAPNDKVLGDTGMCPLEINCYNYTCSEVLVKRIMRMNTDRLPLKAYIMLVILNEKDKNTCATEIRLLVFTHGLVFFL